MNNRRWEKHGDFSVPLPQEIQANCTYFVKYSNGEHTLSLFKRPLKNDPNKSEFKVQLNNLTSEQVLEAINRKNTVILNPHRTYGLFPAMNALLGEWHNNAEWMMKDIIYIDKLVQLNEIKDEVLSLLEIDEKSLGCSRGYK